MPPPSEPESSTVRDQLALDRTRLANERTVLAYIRTALAIAVVGGTLIEFFDRAPARFTGAGLLLASVLLAVVGMYRYRYERKRLNTVLSKDHPNQTGD